MTTTAGIELRAARLDEIERWAALCNRIFDEYPDGYFLGHYQDDPYADPNSVFIALDGEEIVSSARVFTREMYLKGERVRFGGIGEVCTHPDYRNRGLSGALLDMTIDYMEAHDMPISLLFSVANAHYAHRGWFTVPMRYAQIDLPEPTGDGALRPMAEADMAVARGIYGLYAGGIDGATVREHPDYWDRWIVKNWKNPMVYERGGQIIAYADAAKTDEGDCIQIRDFAQLPGEDLAVRVASAAARALDAPARAAIPAAILPEDARSFREFFRPMFRLNRPFYLGGAPIERDGELFRLLGDFCAFAVDGF